MKHYGPNFAVLLARLIGYRRPLLVRLRDQNLTLTMLEREFHAAVCAGAIRWPRGGGRKSVTKARQKLRRTVTFLIFRIVDGLPAKAALIDTALRHRVTSRTIEENLSFAKGLGSGEWWASASRLARKRKVAQLHRMY
jgi:hypothetical protein